ncbi:endolytic transglycosylase MltG [Proteinivorax hydrogeniformans]|uniref:Endolytic murein transglycosylase n=1 Tax=Proteinivorax hydrogeniformans TaxID=1826727 RepID=A0AAU8HRY9_9FIRM
MDKLKTIKDNLSPEKVRIFFSDWTKKKTFFALGISLAVLLIVGVSMIFSLTSPPGDGSQVVQLEIPIGTSTQEIAAKLEENGVIKNQNLFIVYLRLNNLGANFQAGEYDLTDGLTYEEISEALTEGRVAKESVRFTIPEGYTILEISENLESQGLVDGDKFIELIQQGEFEYDFVEGLEDNYHDFRLEGYLYPNTYEVYPDATEFEIIDLMLGEFDSIISDKRNRIDELGLSLHEAVTLASLIEREAKHEDEMSKIASVIFNRLDSGMLLQIDASVLYATGHKDVVTYADLEVDSPYNTYKYKGIPPTPIASPGRAALDAILYPDETEYLFYVADRKTGYHHFAKTYQEHRQNADRYWHID